MKQKTRNQPKIEINPQFSHALELMENTSKSVFITGRAGTGKSTLLNYFRNSTGKKIAVLAPTGVAALNVRGQTIHSFFKFKPNITLEMVKKVRYKNESQSIYHRLETIVIDEISMVRADLLDCVDRFLRLNGPDPEKPFGGVQMIFIGDLYQLPPVVGSHERMLFKTVYDSPYFYSAHVFGTFEMEFVELEKVYRQHDRHFINLLNAIRNNSVTEQDLALLNTRHDPLFEPPPDGFYIYLTTTNASAETINTSELAKLDSPLYTFTAEIEGDFGKEYMPTAIDLNVKTGAQIMMLNNDVEGRWVNGTIGEITGITRNHEGTDVINAELADGETVEIEPFTWEIYQFFVDGGRLESQAVGSFTQYPMMLAWAVTIHKSQGKTFERVIIDIGKGAFAHGQTYVALSRCTSLEGIALVKPLQKKHIWMDFNVVRFLTRFQYRRAEETCSVDARVEIIKRAISDKKALHIIYLKPSDEKSERAVMPQSIGEMEFQGKKYLGFRAFCLKRNEERTFRVDRILEIREL